MTRPTLLLIFLSLALSAAASAGTFTVTLTNGTTFETRYRPVEAEWDDRVVLLSTDRGNRIALLRDDIADVTSSVEKSGFGYQVNTTTLFVGWSFDEGPEEGEEGENANRFDAPEPEPSFTLQQFVNPSTEPAPVGVPADTGF